MFDPLSSLLVFLLTEGLKKLVAFLNDKGFPLVIDGWGALFVAALVAALIAFFNGLVAPLPANVGGLLDFAVKLVLAVASLLLPAVGLHAVVRRLEPYVN